MVVNHEMQVSGKDDTSIRPRAHLCEHMSQWRDSFSRSSMPSSTIRCQLLGCPLYSNISIFFRSQGWSDACICTSRMRYGCNCSFWMNTSPQHGNHTLLTLMCCLSWFQLA
ncbi:hypothetical protein MKX03_031735 [Papaver bracteatum]|nr:hypothetical protein MKX03_031735 [Papaver bracteatum]